jgi:hypothetical protein
MPADPTRPEHLSGEQRFRADLVTYLDSLPVSELAALLCELPVMTRVTLMHELSDRGPTWARLPVTWPQHPDAEHLGRRSLREVLADRRAARAARRSGPPAPLADPGGDRWITHWLARHRLAGAVAERRLAEALRRPAPPLARLREAQAIPARVVLGFAEGLLDRHGELLEQGQPATVARALAVTEAVQAFQADADQRGWTVDQERITGLAHDVLGLEEEYRERHGYPPEQRPALPPSARSWKANAPARRSPCRGGRPTRPSARRACGARNVTRTATTADPAVRPDPGPGTRPGPAAARPRADRHHRAVRRTGRNAVLGR